MNIALAHLAVNASGETQFAGLIGERAGDLDAAGQARKAEADEQRYRDEAGIEEAGIAGGTAVVEGGFSATDKKVFSCRDEKN